MVNKFDIKLVRCWKYHLANFNNALERGLNHGTNLPEHVRNTGPQDHPRRQRASALRAPPWACDFPKPKEEEPRERPCFPSAYKLELVVAGEFDSQTFSFSNGVLVNPLLACRVFLAPVLSFPSENNFEDDAESHATRIKQRSSCFRAWQYDRVSSREFTYVQLYYPSIDTFVTYSNQRSKLTAFPTSTQLNLVSLIPRQLLLEALEYFRELLYMECSIMERYIMECRTMKRHTMECKTIEHHIIEHRTMERGTMEHYIMECRTMKRHTMECKTMQHHIIEHKTMECRTMEQNTMEHHIIEYRTMERRTMEQNTMEHHIIEHRTMERGTMEHYIMECRTMKRHTMECKTMEHHIIGHRTMERGIMEHNTMEHHTMERHTMERRTMEQNTMEYHIMVHRMSTIEL
ncbi:Protein SON [Melipona quadrifasciata]|uniref:Protein SON n=1 Tax=Melipona quadrifasciata TaxID=166423 RepID=A0A0M8ZZQ4_9HYME|nr:Protein SON [Melipona quadrifasciata]